MKTYTSYDQIPSGAAYLGSEDGGGYLDETTADILASATNPVRLREDDGSYSYFDLEG